MGSLSLLQGIFPTQVQFLGWEDPLEKKWQSTPVFLGFPGGSEDKESTCIVGDLGSIPGLGSCPGGGHGNPLQYSCLENPMDRGAWWATVYGVARVGHKGRYTAQKQGYFQIRSCSQVRELGFQRVFGVGGHNSTHKSSFLSLLSD